MTESEERVAGVFLPDDMTDLVAEAAFSKPTTILACAIVFENEMKVIFES